MRFCVKVDQPISPQEKGNTPNRMGISDLGQTKLLNSQRMIEIMGSCRTIHLNHLKIRMPAAHVHPRRRSAHARWHVGVSSLFCRIFAVGFWQNHFDVERKYAHCIFYPCSAFEFLSALASWKISNVHTVIGVSSSSKCSNSGALWAGWCFFDSQVHYQFHFWRWISRCLTIRGFR